MKKIKQNSPLSYRIIMEKPTSYGQNCVDFQSETLNDIDGYSLAFFTLRWMLYFCEASYSLSIYSILQETVLCEAVDMMKDLYPLDKFRSTIAHGEESFTEMSQRSFYYAHTFTSRIREVFGKDSEKVGLWERELLEFWEGHLKRVSAREEDGELVDVTKLHYRFAALTDSFPYIERSQRIGFGNVNERERRRCASTRKRTREMNV